MQIDTVGDDVLLVAWQLEDLVHLIGHVARAGDRASRFVGEPPLDLMDELVHRFRQVSLVPSELGRVHRADQRQSERVLDRGCRVGDEPVVACTTSNSPSSATRVACSCTARLSCSAHGTRSSKVMIGG